MVRRAAVDVEYAMRHFDAPSGAADAKPLAFGGYGVELNLKSVEYKVSSSTTQQRTRKCVDVV